MPTYYVDMAVGHDDNDGEDEGAGNAWKTIQYAVTNSSNGDHVYIKASADYTETVRVVPAAQTLWRTYEGYTTTPGDGGKATIDATSETYGLAGKTGMPPPEDLYNRWENIIVENATDRGINLGLAEYGILVNCESNNNGAGGISIPFESIVANSSAAGNGADGITGTDGLAINCVSSGNAGDGFAYFAAVIGCESISNTDNAIDKASNVNCIYANNTIDGDNDDTAIGVNMGAKSCVIVNNIIYDCVTGISATASTWRGSYIGNNLLDENTADFSNVGDEGDNISDAPGFSDEGGGDYTLASDSAARNAGADASGTSSPGMDIGAHQSEDEGEGGGGGRTIITG